VGSPIIPVKSPITKMTPVPQILELPHLAKEHGVPEVDVGGGGIEADLDRQGFPVARERASLSRSSCSVTRSTAPAPQHLHLLLDGKERLRHPGRILAAALV
jgi:hypothetical protein